MLVVLDDSLLDALDYVSSRNIVISVLQDATTAYRKGTHFLFASIRALDFLRNCNFLSIIDRGI